MTSPFTIFPASSRSGSQAAKLLLKSGHPVRAVARNVSKLEELKSLGAEVVEGDLAKPESVKAALKGSQGLYFVNPPLLDGTDAHEVVKTTAKTLNEALKDSEIKRVVLLSSIGAELPKGTGPISVVHTLEESLKETSSGIELVFIRAASFVENWGPVAKLAVSQPYILPSLASPVDKAFSQVSTSDIAAAASKYLTIPTATLSSSRPTVVELSGPKDISAVDVASVFEKINGGNKVNAIPIQDKDLESTLEQNLPKSAAGELAEMWRAFNNGTIHWSEDGVIKERGETDVELTLRQLV